MKIRNSRSFSFYLLSFLAGLCLGQNQSRASSDQDAQMLLERTLQANKPWLNPSPIQGSYSLVRLAVGSANLGVTGPFSLAINPEPLSYNPAYTYACRVGSLIWTPLHNIALAKMPYTVSMIGSTNYNATSAIAIAVAFNGLARNQFGMGGQGGGSYSSADYPVETARILIEPTNAIPLLIETHTIHTNVARVDPSWVFDPDFFAINGGFAPRAIGWSEPTIRFSERQEFQSFQGEWIFRQGLAWQGNSPGEGDLIQTIGLVDLAIPFPRLALSRSPALVLSWPTYGRTGVVLESSDTPQGPWSALLTQSDYNISYVIVSVRPSKEMQFYRLRK